MKKLKFFLLFAVFMVTMVLLLTISTSAEDTVYSGTWGDLTWELNTTTGELVISGEGAMNDFSSSTDAWLTYKASIKSVNIEDSVTSIGSSAFDNCSSLTTITIPSSVTSIGDRAFYNCTELTSITIPSSVTSIDASTFVGCSQLTILTVQPNNRMYHSDGNCIIETGSKTLIRGTNISVIPSDGSVAHIDNFAFHGCKNLESITIPQGVTSIGVDAFSGCIGLTSIIIPSSVTYIRDGAFSGCSNLESITIPYAPLLGSLFGSDQYTGSIATKQYYGSGQYEYKTLYIPATLKSVTITGDKISYGAFYNCTNLESITTLSDVTHIGNYAFYNCTGLKNITISPSVTSIGSYAFRDCSSLTSIAIPSSVTNIGDSAFV